MFCLVADSAMSSSVNPIGSVRLRSKARRQVAMSSVSRSNPLPEKKHKGGEEGWIENELYKKTHKEKKKKKKEKKKQKKKSKGSGFWSELLKVGGSLLMQFLPMLLGDKKAALTSAQRVNPTSPSIGVSFTKFSATSKKMLGETTEHVLPLAVGSETSASIPEVLSMGGGKIMIRHRGRLCTIPKAAISTAADALPGQLLYRKTLDTGLEPWLTRIAAFQKYCFKNVAVTYIPAVPVTVPAKVCGYFELDVDAPSPTDQGDATLQNISVNPTAKTVDSWTPHIFGISFSDPYMYYTSSTYHEPRTSKQAIFSLVASSDMTSADIPDTLGELWVSYECELYFPSMTDGPAMGQSLTIAGDLTSESAMYPFGATPTAGSLADTSVTPNVEIPNRLTWTCRSTLNGAAIGNVFNFTEGYYMVFYEIRGTDLVKATDPVTYAGYASPLNWVGGTAAEGTVAATLVFGVNTFRSTGFGEDRGLIINLTSVSTITIARLVVVSLGGSLPYQSPFMSELTDLKEKVLELSLRVAPLKEVSCSSSSSSSSSSVSSKKR